MIKNCNNYCPNQQDIIWIDFLPSIKEEIRGRHPAVVLSTEIYTKITGLVAVCPITHAANNRLKDFFIPLKSTGKINGYINPLQIFTFSFNGRNGENANQKVENENYAFIQRSLKEVLNIK